MFVCTPMSITLSMPRLSSRFQISTPESLMASSSLDLDGGDLLPPGRPCGHCGPSSQPPSD